jgi:histidine triad (HIT) family protein
MAEKNIFQKIIDKEIPAEIVYEDNHCVAFRDIQPEAPVHLLLVPKKEISSIDAITEADVQLLGHLWLVVGKLAQPLGLERGYRVVANCGPDGGQIVQHLHFHLLGGRELGWPPG